MTSIGLCATALLIIQFLPQEIDDVLRNGLVKNRAISGLELAIQPAFERCRIGRARGVGVRIFPRRNRIIFIIAQSGSPTPNSIQIFYFANGRHGRNVPENIARIWNKYWTVAFTFNNSIGDTMAVKPIKKNEIDQALEKAMRDARADDQDHGSAGQAAKQQLRHDKDLNLGLPESDPIAARKPVETPKKSKGD